MQKILVVDDEADNVDALERLFRKKHDVLKATSGPEGLKLLAKNRVALIISDQRMPEMTGVEFLKESMTVQPDAIRILLTGYTDLESVVDAVNSGEIYRYLAKPWDPVDLANTVDKAVEKFELRYELEAKNRALTKALGELKTLDHAKNQFMVLINHELKSPLTVILSFLELLKETKLNDEQEKYLSKIEKSGFKLKSIIDDVLTLVSAEAGLTKINKKQIKLGDLVHGVTNEFAALAESRGQSFALEIEDHTVEADAQIIRSVIRRIVENAVKFGDKKSNILLRAIKPRSETKDTVMISVVNHGAEIPEETIEKILKPFTLDEDMLNHSEGLGLGLSLCQALLKRHHNGELRFKSSDGTTRVGFEL